MIVRHRCEPLALPEAVSDSIRKDIEAALNSIRTVGSRFIVNDTRWLARRSQKFTPVVMNAAEFISKQFQNGLEARGWSKEKNIDEQKIDAFRTFKLRFEGYYLDEAGLRALIDQFWTNKQDFAPLIRHFWPTTDEPTVDQVVWWLAQMYFRRRIHDLSALPNHYHQFFRSTGAVEHEIRVGVEFESGNIASAFRAFTKLNNLYRLGEIDLGVFVATNRATSTRIWPASNRNVSYDELENRQYKRNVFFPIWEVEFEPDGYSADAPYLRKTGDTYVPEPTGDTVTLDGRRIPVFTRHDRERLILV